jgi:hypothetical protein
MKNVLIAAAVLAFSAAASAACPVGKDEGDTWRILLSEDKAPVDLRGKQGIPQDLKRDDPKPPRVQKSEPPPPRKPPPPNPVGGVRG